MVGEVASSRRPLNSALEADLDFESSGGWEGDLVCLAWEGAAGSQYDSIRERNENRNCNGISLQHSDLHRWHIKATLVLPDHRPTHLKGQVHKAVVIIISFGNRLLS